MLLNIIEFVDMLVQQLEEDGVENAADEVQKRYGIRIKIPPRAGQTLGGEEGKGTNKN